MLQELSPSQLEEWIAYDKIDPIGPDRFDALISALYSLIMDLGAGLAGQKGSGLTIRDFLTWVEFKDKSATTVEEMKSVFYSIAARQGTRKRRFPKEGTKAIG